MITEKCRYCDKRVGCSPCLDCARALQSSLNALGREHYREELTSDPERIRRIECYRLYAELGLPLLYVPREPMPRARPSSYLYRKECA